VAAGLWLHAAGIRDIRRYRSEGALVTQGIYAKLRHPIYYGWVIVANAMPLMFLSWLGLVTAPVWCAIVLAIALLEEHELRATLPPGEYDAYADGTWL
jgi:protein-S-isoprenylcysteine O-methyltransferase Ste14